MISQEFRVLLEDNDSIYVALAYYGDSDPWAIHMSCGDKNNWVFARNILIDGDKHHSGLGDVRVWPGGRFTHMMLESPDGRTLLRFPRGQLQLFVNDTCDLVPRGTEVVNMDDMISEIFKKEAR